MSFHQNRLKETYSVDIRMNKRNKSLQQIQHDSVPYVMLIPGIVGIFFVNLIPCLQALIMGFHADSHCQGNLRRITEFRKDFLPAGVLASLGNTFFWSLASLVFATILGIITATLVNRPYPGRSFSGCVFLVPWVTPPVVSSMVWKTIFNETLSPINDLLLRTHLIDSPIGFLTNPTWRIG